MNPTNIITQKQMSNCKAAKSDLPDESDLIPAKTNMYSMRSRGLVRLASIRAPKMGGAKASDRKVNVHWEVSLHCDVPVA